MAEEKEIKTKQSNARWWVLGTVIFGTFLGRLDQTVVNLALPKIIGDFSISVSDAAWISTAYILANAVFVPVWGKLGDTAGRKKIYLIGFIGFIIASGLCAVAWNLPSMIVFRVIQGLSVSADYPTAMAIIAITFKDMKERAQALGIWSAAFAAASVFGPLIGGPLIDNFNWRAVFFINIPLGIIGLFLALTFIDESVGEKRQTHFDWWGSIILGRRARRAHYGAGPGADVGMGFRREHCMLYRHHRVRRFVLSCRAEGNRADRRFQIFQDPRICQYAGE